MGKTQELREAFVAGAETMALRLGASSISAVAQAVIEQDAAEAFPTPTVERPRIIDVDGGQYRIADGAIQFRFDADDEWGVAWFDVERVQALAELIANPTETVEVAE